MDIIDTHTVIESVGNEKKKRHRIPQDSSRLGGLRRYMGDELSLS